MWELPAVVAQGPPSPRHFRGSTGSGFFSRAEAAVELLVPAGRGGAPWFAVRPVGKIPNRFL